MVSEQEVQLIGSIRIGVARIIPSSSEEKLTFDLQTIHDQQVVRSFNNLPNAGIPQIRLVILKSISFGVVTMVGFDQAKVESRDITIKISHNSFISKVMIWFRINNGPSGWHMIAQLQQQFHFTTYLA